MSEKKKYTDCFVAYLDIIGFKERVKETEESHESLLNTLIEALQINSIFTQSGTKNTSDGKLDIRSFFFSDSFVFMLKEKKDDLHHLFIIIRYLQDRLWKSELCLRGAITRGKMYWPEKEENITLGPAMLEAYVLESSIAIYPRIVVSDGLFEWISNNEIKADLVIKEAKLKDAIRRDKDGVYFFDVLNPSIVRRQDEEIKSGNGSFCILMGTKGNNYPIVLKSIKKIIKNNMTEEDEKIKQKYEWLKSYSKRKFSRGA